MASDLRQSAALLESPDIENTDIPREDSSKVSLTDESHSDQDGKIEQTAGSLHTPGAGDVAHSSPSDSKGRRNWRTRIPKPLQLAVRWIWLWECISAYITLGFLIAAIIIMAKYKDRPAREWPYETIGITTVVSILATLIRASIALPVTEGISQLKWSWFRRDRPLKDMAVFDSCSRGPWGAALMSISLHKWSLATVGALVIALSLAIGPFMQQAVQTELTRLNTTDVARVNICGTSNYHDADEKVEQNQQGNGVSRGSIGTMYNAILGTSSSNVVPTDCRTGNCTFSRYQSFGLCNTCQDISTQIRRITRNNDEEGGPGREVPECDAADNNCSLELRSRDGNDSILAIPNPSLGSIMVTALDGISSENSTLGAGIVSFTALLNGDYGPGDWVGQTSAIQCKLTYCVYDIDANLTLGRLDEKWMPAKVQFEQDRTIGGGKITPEACYRGGTLKKPPFQLKDDCIYSLTGRVFSPLQTSLMTMLDGTIEANLNLRIIYSSDIIQGLFGNGSIQSIEISLSTLAAEMTNHWRTDPKICPGTFADGTVQSLENVIRIYWLWMILPIVLVATSIVFFVWVMVVNWHEDVWKSSPLPLLFFGLDQSTREALVEDLGDEATVQGMEDTAASVKVHFDRTDNVLSMRTTRDF